MATVIKKVKVLLDEHQEPFIPFVTTDAVFKNGSDEKLTDFLDNYIAQKDEQVETFLEEADTDIAELIRQAGVDVNAIIQDLEYKRDHGYFTGPPGPQGDPGIQGEPGEQGEPGAGVVPGGTTGQVLTKKSDNDYDTEWADASDMSDYYTKEETDDKIDEEIAKIPKPDMSNYYNKEEVDSKDDVLRERINEIELSKFPNVTIFGEPTILQGQVSNFSADDYLEFPFMVDFRGRPFEINFTFTTGDDIDSQQNILDSDFGLAFAIRSKHIVLAVSYNGTSWALERTGSLVLESQKTYRIRISWDGSSYKVQYSIDGGTTYIDDITFDSTQTPYPKQMYIGVGKLASNYFKGSINLNYADVKISDHVIWQGVDDAGLALRADINLENITEVAVQKIRNIAGELIIDALERDY